MLSARLNEAEDEAEGGPICMRCSSYDECDGHGLLLSDLLALPAAASARTSTCSVLNVKTVVTASINTRPQDGCWSPAHAFQMVAAAVACLLRSVDVGAQAPTQSAVKMAARPSCAARCARYRRYGLLFCCRRRLVSWPTCFDKLRFIGRGKKALAHPSPLPLMSSRRPVRASTHLVVSSDQ